MVSTRRATDPPGTYGSMGSTFARGYIGASTRWPRARKPSRWSGSSPGACGIVATRCLGATEAGPAAARELPQPQDAAVVNTSVGSKSLAPDLGAAGPPAGGLPPIALTLGGGLPQRRASVGEPAPAIPVVPAKMSNPHRSPRRPHGGVPDPHLQRRDRLRGAAGPDDEGSWAFAEAVVAQKRPDPRSRRS